MKIVNLKDVAPLKNKIVEKFNGEKNYIATGNLDDNQNVENVIDFSNSFERKTMSTRWSLVATHRVRH